MTFKCKPNCAECCGIIGIPKELAMKNQHLSQIKPKDVIESDGKLYIITPDMFCVYLNRETKKCVIYEDRPEICRIYGMIPACPCPHFDLNGRRRNRNEACLIQIQINQTVNRALELAKQNVQTMQ